MSTDLNRFSRSVTQPCLGTPVKVTPSDSVALPFQPRAIRVTQDGVGTLVYADGTTAVAFPCSGDNDIGNMVRLNATGWTAGDVWLLP